MRKSILIKMLVQTLIPAILVFVVAAMMILSMVKGSMTELTTSDLTSRSEAA